MTTLLDAALQLAAQAHAGQRRKCTNHPYLTHCLEVVNILIDHGIDDQVMLAAAALHDVIEDTPQSAGNLDDLLRRAIFGYFGSFSTNATLVKKVVTLVQELTEPDHQGNRATRKAAEAVRLSQISADAQTIKYADLISNTGSITQHDVGFARVYLQEKWNILKVMRDGDALLLGLTEAVCLTAADAIGLELV